MGGSVLALIGRLFQIDTCKSTVKDDEQRERLDK
jgi:hypothetical protein